MRMILAFTFLQLIGGLFFVSCKKSPKQERVQFTKQMITDTTITTQTATFGAGCFWCVEAVFQQLDGVQSVASGYSGGHVDNPTYKQVCNGNTGHAEVIQITYNPQEISFAELLEAFWSSHDPTTLNRQGADVGTQYRSVIYYHNNEQKELAEKFKKDLNTSNAFSKPVVTEISPFTKFIKRKIITRIITIKMVINLIAEW
jgi:peptide-methionine (S)-S-oxide reductase